MAAAIAGCMGDRFGAGPHAGSDAAIKARLEEPSISPIGPRIVMSPRTPLMWGAAVFGSLLAALIFLVAGTPSRHESVVASQVFLLRDDDGRVRGEWSTKVDGAPKLWFYDERGSRRIELSLLSDGSAGLRLLDSREQIRASLGIIDGEPLLTCGTRRATSACA